MEEKNNGLTIILVVVIVALLGFGAFYLITQNNAPKQPVNTNNQNTQNTKPIEEIPEEVDEEDVVLPVASVLEMEGNTNVLFSLLENAALDTVLNDVNTKYTIFAPVDPAFAAITLPADDVEGTQKLLKYHVVKGNILATDVVQLDGKEIETLSGDKLKISVVDGVVLLNGTIKVIDTDIPAANGVIHLVEGVLMPQ